MPYSDMMNQHISPILMKTEAEYQTPITIHDKPIGRLHCKRADCVGILNSRLCREQSTLFRPSKWHIF